MASPPGHFFLTCLESFAQCYTWRRRVKSKRMKAEAADAGGPKCWSSDSADNEQTKEEAERKGTKSWRGDYQQHHQNRMARKRGGGTEASKQSGLAVTAPGLPPFGSDPNLPGPSADTTQTVPASACTSTRDTPRAISAALEVKFLLPLLPLSAGDPHPADARGVLRAQIPNLMDLDTGALQRQGYADVAGTINHVPRQRATTATQIAARGLRERDFWDSHWIVKRANSAEPARADPRYDDYLWVPVELSSPKLPWRLGAYTGLGSGFGRYRCCSTPMKPARESGQDRARELPWLWPDVGEVLRAITTRHRCVTNYTCDVHVHVGRTDGRPFSLLTLKRLATLLWLAESRLRSVRDPHSPNFDNTFTWGAEQRKHSRLARALRDGDPNSLSRLSSGTDAAFRRHMGPACRGAGIDPTPPPGGAGRGEGGSGSGSGSQTKEAETMGSLRAIWRVATHRELGRMLSGDTKQFRRLGFNFSGFGGEDERARAGPRTVEFRHLDGTLQSGLVLGWMHICCALLEVSLEDPPARFLRTVQDLLRDAIAEEEAEKKGRSSPGPSSSPSPSPSSQAAEAFARLMDDLGVQRSVYEPFQRKIVSDRRADREAATDRCFFEGE